MPKYRKKLIEVDLPLTDISSDSYVERYQRHGHPSRVHLWWARRPLASCRAVIFAPVSLELGSGTVSPGGFYNVSNVGKRVTCELVIEVTMHNMFSAESQG